MEGRYHSAMPTPSFVDIGINLTHSSFDHDRLAVIDAAHAAGVRTLIVTGADLQSSRAASELASSCKDRIWSTAGVHPHHAAALRAEDERDFLQLLESPRVVAVGECGLDYFRDLSPRPAQRAAFERQLDWAKGCGKPVFLHQRDAHADFVSVLRQQGAALAGGVAHCFTGGRQELEEYLDLGLYIGVTGWVCDERRGQPLREAVPHVPSTRLLIETDAPYLLPRDLLQKPGNRRNEPCNLPHIARVLAGLRGESLEELATRTSENASRLFGFPAA